MAGKLVRYCAKGGQFRTPSDLKRLYGMTDQLFETLEPYISIDSMAFVTPSDLLLTDTILLLVELNAADRSEENTFEFQSHSDTSYSVFCLKQTHITLLH